MAAPDIKKIAGPMLVGYLLNWGLFGALSIQLFFYYLSFPKDRWGSKLMIAFIYLMEAAQTFIITNDCFLIYVTHYGDMENLNNLQLEGIAVPVFTSVVSCAVQLFYAYRLFLLSKRRYMVMVVCMLSVTQLVAGIYTGIDATLVGSFSGLQKSRAVQVGEGLWLAGSALCDVIIATSMIYLLLRRETSNRATHNLINRLVRLIVETGTLTAVMAILSLILYYSFPGLPFHTPVAAVLSKLYSNSALAIFNSRIHILGGRESTNGSTKMHISLNPGPAQPLANKIDSCIPPGPILIEEDVYVHSDERSLKQQGPPTGGLTSIGFVRSSETSTQGSSEVSSDTL